MILEQFIMMLYFRCVQVNNCKQHCTNSRWTFSFLWFGKTCHNPILFLQILGKNKKCWLTVLSKKPRKWRIITLDRSVLNFNNVPLQAVGIHWEKILISVKYSSLVTVTYMNKWQKALLWKWPISTFKKILQ